MTCQHMALHTCYLPGDGLFRNTWPVLLKESVSCVSCLCPSTEFLGNGMLSLKLKCVHYRIRVSGEITALSNPR